MRKILIVSLCALLMVGVAGSWDGVKAAGGNPDDGFIIEADRVVGSGMTATIVNQETSEKDAQPMLRFHYDSATIYGMRLTKKSGSTYITLRASGPVQVKGMTVDTTAITFKGTCLHAGESLPEIGMDHVIMVAHYMNTSDSELNGLVLDTASGKMDIAMPGELQILQDLSLLPVNQLEKEIRKISAGQLPLICEDLGKKNGGLSDTLKDFIGIVKNPLDPLLKPIVPVLEPVLAPLDPVLKPLDPVLKPVEPVLKPLEPVLKPVEPVLKPLDPVLKPVESVLKPLEPVLKPVEPVIKPLEPVLKPVESMLKPLNPVLKPLDPVLKPLEPMLTPLDPILKPANPSPCPAPEPPPGESSGNPLDPIVIPLDPVLKPLDPILNPLDPILAPILKP